MVLHDEVIARATRVNPRQAITKLTPDFREAEPVLYAAWKRLFADDDGAYALQHPDWVLAEAAPASVGALLQAWDGDRIAALGVLVARTVQTRKVSGPGLSWSLHGLRLAGNRFLRANGGDDAALAALVDQTLHHAASARADFLMIEDIERSSALMSACETAAKQAGWMMFVPKGWQPRLRIALPKTPDDYWKRFSSKTRSTFRRKLKKFGATRLEKVTHERDVTRFLDHARAISAQTWQTRQLGLRVRADDTEIACFKAAAGAGLLRSYLWFVNDEAAAFLIGNQTHGTFNYEEVGYATKFARNSPGQMLLLQVLEELYTDDTPQLFDFGGGDADYKRMFSNQQSESGTIWLVPPTLRMRAVLGYVKAYTSLAQRARRQIAGSPWATRLRQRVRYGGASAAPHVVEPSAEPSSSEEPKEP